MAGSSPTEEQKVAGNYGLEAAILLSRRLNAPLMVVCLVPSSLIYPACHAATASDAYTRYSFVEMYEQFAQVKVPFYGITAKEDGSLVPQAEKQPFILEPNPLFQLLDAITPQAVQLHLEEVDWRVVKAANSQSSPQMQRFSEAKGLQKLSQLLAESRGQPAIQAELQGGGILSLLPFIRHGSLFAGYVLRRISEAIVSCPAPNTPQERKALAMRKVRTD
ncbi:hypothetical protein BBJ28_00013191 [Nothophytophthora sp. Chile5]|nr:hypothetical protein BBJ28_00013191 [Nothophytophthora sp. Chile5]